MSEQDLSKLEYPRHLHKEHGDYLRVNSRDEAKAAIADGWCVDVPVAKGDEKADKAAKAEGEKLDKAAGLEAPKAAHTADSGPAHKDAPTPAHKPGTGNAPSWTQKPPVK